ncbi:GGDEF domain-containing protein [Thiolapillus sp.]
MLDINLITLSFQDPRLERHYRNSYSRRYRFQSLLAMEVALVLFGLFAVLDWLLYPQLVEQLWGIRFGFALPALLIIFILLLGRVYFRYGQQLMVASLIVSNVAVVAMTVVIPAHLNDVYVAGLMLVALYGYTVARLRFVWATAGNWFGVIAYNLANIWWGDASHWDLVAGNFFCISTNVMGMVASYSMEYDSRRGFLLQQQLRRERSQLNLVNRRLEKQVLTDELTDLANRRSFFERFHEEWRRVRRERQYLALVMIDIDHFKEFNDAFGHQAGDECLKQVAAVFQEHARRAGDVPARLGGEEFVLLLPETSPVAACEKAEAVRKSVARMEIHAPQQGLLEGRHISISCGIAAVVPDQESSPDDLLAQADKALYQAKEQGRNRVVCCVPGSVVEDCSAKAGEGG